MLFDIILTIKLSLAFKKPTDKGFDGKVEIRYSVI
jgi:hypothetical protein